MAFDADDEDRGWSAADVLGRTTWIISHSNASCCLFSLDELAVCSETHSRRSFREVFL